MLQRDYKETPLDGGENPPKNITVRYLGNPCLGIGLAAKQGQLELLQAVIDGPGLLDCGLVPFQTLTMTHNGKEWELVIQARV